MPVRNYDNLFVGSYIRAIENPDSVGFKNGKWYAPDLKGYDSNNRGFGVDVRFNKEAAALTKNRKDKWLTEEEERDLRNAHIGYAEDILHKWTPEILAQPVSEAKKAMGIGMIYRGDGIGSIVKNPKVRDAYYGGTDVEMAEAVEEFYKKKGLNKRAELHRKVMQSNSDNATRSYDWGSNQYQFPVSYSEGGTLEKSKVWNDLSLAEKSEMMKAAIRNGITDNKAHAFYIQILGKLLIRQ